MRFAASQHQKKAAPFVKALIEHGHQLTHGEADAYLLDLDTPYNKHLYESRLARGEKVFLYPHGAFTAWFYDGPFEPDERITAHFLTAKGIKEVYRRIGVNVPAYVVGWPWCKIEPFRACAEPRKVLFGPHHPLADGRLCDQDQQKNRRIFEDLLALPDIELTVRHVLSLERNGIYHVDGVRFVEAHPDNGTAEIDEADVVVTGHTMAYIAIARGTPTVMFDARDTPYAHHNPDDAIWVADGTRYAELTRYPYDVSDGPIGGLIKEACASDDAIREWRDNFIGNDFDPSAFSILMNELIREPFLEDELRERVVIAWADEIAERPDLLATYAKQAAGDDTTTLVLYAPDCDEESVVPTLQAAIEASGVTEDQLPDMLVTALPKHEVHERTMARRASAVLTDRDVDGPLADLPSVIASGRDVGVRT
jgi:hypothetical protein